MTKKWTVVIGCARLLLKPLLVGVIAGLIWVLFIFPTGFNVGKNDETILTNTVAPLLGMFHGFIAAGVLQKAWTGYRQYEECKLARDQSGADRCLRDRIPRAIHLLLGVMSFMIVAIMMIVDYKNPCAGLASIGAISFVLALYWIVATTLDNPASKAWFIEDVEESPAPATEPADPGPP